MHARRFLRLLAAPLWAASALRLACNTAWIEHTPQAYTFKNTYKGDTPGVLVSGGAASLSDASIDLAANAETQGLKQYATHRNYRLIYVIVEVSYRLVARRDAGVARLADLRGKRIGTASGSSAEVFVRQLLSTAGLAHADYTLVSGGVCMRAPCAAGSFPAMLRDRKIDAFGIWEPAVELGVQAVGEAEAVLFQNASVYREIYSLYSTVEKLRDPPTRKKIVEFVRALNQTLDLFRNEPDKVYAAVGQTVGVDVPVLKDVWADHKWGPGSLGPDLLDYLVVEDEYLAKTDKRAGISRADLAKFIDTSVYDEALALKG
ncbi:hypothetical protein B0H67DRAFT_644262 [Lasiosphaeris hirsuta]|uniref:SsuA/THI5-like domain-containing protein n=1 Tax=Lasiosphaeris hirsuta TaxID=260670 RepID=A0AA40DYG0_9PEZI|nr:hypothetical protein B0H67DRAFT_644262 [Lasiosphaeris hirsuta]